MLICGHLTFFIHAENQIELDTILAQIEQSTAIDIEVLGPQLQKQLDTNISTAEKSKLLRILINVYFTDGYQDKIKQFAQSLLDHGQKFDIADDIYIAELFLMAESMNVSYLSQDFHQALQNKKSVLQAHQLDDKRIQLDIMLTTLAPQVFKFSHEQILINHLTEIELTATDTYYEFFIYKSLANSNSDINQVLHYSQKLLNYAEAHQLPVNRLAILHVMGYWYQFRRMTTASRKCLELQKKIAYQINNPREIFFAQVREVEQFDQEQKYPAMLDLINEMKATDNIPDGFWKKLIDYYNAVALANTGAPEAAKVAHQRLLEHMSSEELQPFALSEYLLAHIAFNQQEFESAKQLFNDFWWKKYNHALTNQENEVNAVRSVFQTLVNEKNESIKLAEQRLTLFIWLSALLFLLITVIIFLIIKVLHHSKALIQHRNQLKISNRTDDLTQLYNRRYLQKQLHKEFDFLRNNNGSESVLVMVDIDRFKQINDSFGHLAGDKVISEVAQIIKKHLKATDICGRFGGEEFLIMLREANSQQAMDFAERLRSVIENKSIIYQDKDITTTCSIGVAPYAGAFETCHEWIQHADLTMYKSKALGRNQTQLYHPSIS